MIKCCRRPLTDVYTHGFNTYYTAEDNHTQYLHCMSTIVVAASEVPTTLLAVQRYKPDLFLCIFGINKVGPLWRTLMGLSVLYHLHVILELGLAAVTLHSNVAVCPSLTLYGLNVLDVTSGLSKNDVIYIYIPFNAFKTTCFTLINRTFICLNVKLIILLTLHVYIYIKWFWCPYDVAGHATEKSWIYPLYIWKCIDGFIVKHVVGAICLEPYPCDTSIWICIGQCTF